MLPHLKQKLEASVAAPSDKITRDSDEEDQEYDGLVGAMEELHSALMAKDYQEAAEIFRSAFQLMDSEPHIEGPHEEPK